MGTLHNCKTSLDMRSLLADSTITAKISDFQLVTSCSFFHGCIVSSSLGAVISFVGVTRYPFNSKVNLTIVHGCSRCLDVPEKVTLDID